MFNVKNLKIIFLALLLAGAMSVLCMADEKKSKGTRVDSGAHADILNNGVTLRLVVQYLNPSNDPITINKIKIYGPDGIEVFPNFPVSFPVLPFDLGPFEAKGFSLGGVGIQPVAWPPRGIFQVHTSWETDRDINGLKSFSVVISNSPTGEVSRHAVEGFDIKIKE